MNGFEHVLFFDYLQPLIQPFAFLRQIGLITTSLKIDIFIKNVILLIFLYFLIMIDKEDLVMSTNKKRRTMFIWMLLIVLMTTMVHPMEHVTADESDYEWTENDDGGATITGYTGATTDVVIPDTLGGL